MVNCTSDQIINSTGLCQYCLGPSFYKPLPGPSNQTIVLQTQECQKCPDDIFRCEGGTNVTTLVGYQRLSNQTDEFIKCPL